MRLVVVGSPGSMCKAYIDITRGEAVSRFRAEEPSEWTTKDGKRGVPVREFEITGDSFFVQDVIETPLIEEFIEC